MTARTLSTRPSQPFSAPEAALKGDHVIDQPGHRPLAALAGLAFVVLLVGGGVVHGSSPGLNATATQIASFYRAHHSAVVVSILMAAVSSVLLIFLAASVAAELGASGRRVAAGTLLASITAASAVAVLSGGVEIGLAQAAVHSPAPGFLHGAYVLAISLYPVGYLFVALAMAAVVLGGRGRLPVWFLWLSAIVAVLNVLGGVSVASSGFFASNDGGAIVFAGVGLSVWVLAASWILWRRPQPAAQTVVQPST
jgi:hypothetical protein